MVPARRSKFSPANDVTCPDDLDVWDRIVDVWREVDLGDEPPGWLREYPEVLAFLTDLEPPSRAADDREAPPPRASGIEVVCGRGRAVSR